jgi:SpoVK/Ycf46/Vps4 family AAA+-type ATPase
MDSDRRFMNELFRIINGALRLDTDKVRSYSAFLADRLEAEGDQTTARRLRKLLTETDHELRPAKASFAPALPVDAESRFSLVERVRVRGVQEPPLALADEQWDVLNEFVSIAKSHALLDAEGVAGSINLLMYGPPGTGKSRVAREIARRLDIDLYVARLDGLISSFLGSTAKNIRALFEFASRTPCVLFLDELDAIAKLRGDSQELGELKRVVNSFIQNLDSLGGQSPILAATNHPELLDSAIWRRFGYRLEFDYPTLDMRRQLWQEFFDPLEPAERDVALLADLSEGFSGSDIEEVCRRLRRRSIVSGISPELHDVFVTLENVGLGEGEGRRFLTQLRDQDENAITSILRARNERLYSHKALAQLLGISKSTAYRRSLEGMRSDV